MSETPTLPISDETNAPVAHYAGGRENYKAPQYQGGGEFYVPRFEQQETLDLHSDDAIDLARWTQEEIETPVQAIERIEEARRPKTRAQEVEESLFYLTDKQLLAYAIANTKAVWALKHLI